MWIKAPINSQTKHGYLCIEREWQSGDKINLMLEMPIERIVPNPAIIFSGQIVQVVRCGFG
jgi:DUF1680 family protein